MNRATLLDSLEHHEGFSSHPYRDSLRLWTFGIGRCLQTNPLKPEEFAYLLDNSHLTLGITEVGAQWLMEREVDGIVKALVGELSFWPGLADTAQNVLIEMAYQMGEKKLFGFNKMMSCLSRYDYVAAAVEGLDSTWAKQTPKRAQELMGRLSKA